jgi:class 3 adenylate cyclase
LLFGAGYILFLTPGWLLNPVPVAMTALVTYAVVLARRWWLLRRIFAVVKSEEITRALEADPSRLDPGGEIREITALFVDIRGFTTFSEECGGDPKQVVALLNTYFSVVIPCIENEKGTIVNFMGDGLMVIFGAPVTLPDHAARATRAALAIVNAVKSNLDQWTKHRFANFRVGIGIHTGLAVIGAIGSGVRKDYTAIGDTINTASRVEGETKNFKVEILVTDATRKQLETKPELSARSQAIAQPVTVKGRMEPIQLYLVK